ANDYEYAGANPINTTDLDGQCWICAVGHWAWNHKWDIALTAVTFVPGLGEAAWAFRAARFISTAGKIGDFLADSRLVGTASRLFGDAHRGGGVTGMLNRGSRFALGWSAQSSKSVGLGKGAARVI